MSKYGQKYEIFSALVLPLLLLLPSTNPFIKVADIKSASNFKDLSSAIGCVQLHFFFFFLVVFGFILAVPNNSMLLLPLLLLNSGVIFGCTRSLSLSTVVYNSGGDKQNDASVNRHTPK